MNPERIANGSFVMLRGWPRNASWVKEAESELGGKLVHDNEITLMSMLDKELYRLRKKHGKYPDYIKIPGDSGLYLPVPFEVNFQGLPGKSYVKPAWFRVKKGFKPSWK